MIRDFIKRAKAGESLYICEVRGAFASMTPVIKVVCSVETATGENHQWTIPLPCIDTKSEPEEREFIRNYFIANIYNIISTFGGKHMTLFIVGSDGFIEELCNGLDDVFQVDTPRIDRSGFGKCLNVTDRINAAMGFPPFRFIISRGTDITNNKSTQKRVDSVGLLKTAVKSASSATLIGVDIGGTDIKAVGSVNGRIVSLKEYDWNPAGMTEVWKLVAGIELVVKEICDDLGETSIPDGIGVGFPDVIIMNKIVGGETMKTRGIRNASPDYETEFAELLKLNDMLLDYCKPGGVINMTNDGSLAAFTAAVELAFSNRADEVTTGIFAHTLGTELGTGWVDESGEIPQIPLEIYNCVIDLGNYPAREFKPFDLRSILNFNTGIAGTMQKYASQSGAYRLAIEYFKKDAPELFDELFEKGFIEEKDGGIYVITSPVDKRKPLLEFIMKLANNGQPQAEKVFREIGKCLAATYEETVFLLNPEAKQRILYGRFVKSQKCLRLLQEGASEKRSFKMEAGNDDLAFTPLMQALRDNPDYTVAQFGQAVGAVYFAASGLK